jgi:hypothetical protein
MPKFNERSSSPWGLLDIIEEFFNANDLADGIIGRRMAQKRQIEFNMILLFLFGSSKWKFDLYIRRQCEINCVQLKLTIDDDKFTYSLLGMRCCPRE